jgi:hypothetical protein
VSDPDIALCLEMLERTNASDIEGLLSYCHEDVECEPFLAQVEGGAFSGHAGMRRWWEERDAAWETIRIEPGEIRRVGRHLVMSGVFHTKARGSGMEISVSFAQGALIRDGKVAWWGVYSTEDEALERVKSREAEL